MVDKLFGVKLHTKLKCEETGEEYSVRSHLRPCHAAAVHLGSLSAPVCLRRQKQLQELVGDFLASDRPVGPPQLSMCFAAVRHWSYACAVPMAHSASATRQSSSCNTGRQVVGWVC